MVSDSPNSNADSPRTDTPSSNEVGNPEKKKTLAGFLIETEVKPLVLVGQCVNFFGLGTVVGFLTGAAIVYGVAMFRPLPYAKATGAPENGTKITAAVVPTEPKKVKLHGFVTDGENKPVKDFFVAVLASQHGPFDWKDGEFLVDVSQRDDYDIVLWSEDRKKMQVFHRFPLEQDRVGFSFGNLRLLPTAAPVSQGPSASLNTKSTDRLVAKSPRISERMRVHTLRSE